MKTERVTFTKSDIRQYSDIFTNIDPIFSNQSLPKKVKVYLFEKLYNADSGINLNDVVWTKNGKPQDFKNTFFYSINKPFCDETGELKSHVLSKLLERFSIIKNENKVELTITTDESETEIQTIEEDLYELKHFHNITHVNDALFKSAGNCAFHFNFEDKSLKMSTLDFNIKTVQRFRIQVNGALYEYADGARLHYRCGECGAMYHKSKNDIVSSNFKCLNNVPTSAGKSKVCNTTLRKPTQLTDNIKVYTYDASYKPYSDSNDLKNIRIDTYEKLEFFEYECVGIMLTENSCPYLQILAVKPMPKHVLDYEQTLPDIKTPRPNDATDQVIKILDFLDNTITNWSGKPVLGMYDLKFAMLMQKLTHLYNHEKVFNIAIVGKNGVGKTYIIDHYGALLYGGMYKYSAGLSISIPSLRGSSKSNYDMSKGNKNKPGLLEMHHLICIDEINYNKTLMEGLKGLLLTDSFSNDMADGDKTKKKKNAHVNITENPDTQHLGLHNAMIKKMYEEKVDDSSISKTSEDDGVDQTFSLDWDLMQPLYTYDNWLLRYCIKEVRTNFFNKDIHWIDGNSLAEHDRFPYYIYLKAAKGNEISMERMYATGHAHFNKDKIQMDLNAVLSSENMDDFLKSFEKFTKVNVPLTSQNKSIKEVLNIINSYGFEPNDRLMKICLKVLDFSRILNQRLDYSNVDFKHVKRYLTTKDRVLYHADMLDLEPEEPRYNDNDLKVSDDTVKSAFGMPENEFDNLN